MGHLTEETLLDELRSLAWKLQRHPTTTDMDQYGAYSSQTYQNRFDSWVAALEAAGVADLTEPTLDTEELLSALRAVPTNIPAARRDDATDSMPTHESVREYGTYSPWLYIDTFESWLDALDAAGFETTVRTNPTEVTATDEELHTALYEIAVTLNRTPTPDEMTAYGDYPSHIYADRYGSWSAAVEDAELPSSEASRQTIYSETELLSHLKELAAELESTPTIRDLKAHGKYSPLTYQYRFGSWNNAVIEAGLEPNDTPKQKISDEKLLAELRTLAAELEKTPSRIDMITHGAHSATVYETRFGSWNNAVRAADLTPNTSSRNTD